MAFLRLDPAPVKNALDPDGKVQIAQSWSAWFARVFSVVNSIVPSVGRDIGDADTTITVGVSAQTQLYGSPITATRTVTLSTERAVNGSMFTIVRQSTSTGAFSVDVGGLKNLTPGTWCDVQMTENGWALIRSGSL